MAGLRYESSVFARHADGSKELHFTFKDSADVRVSWEEGVHLWVPPIEEEASRRLADPFPTVTKFGIEERFRSRGYGREALTIIEDLMREDGYRQIIIKPPRKDAVKFYKKCGYYDSAGPYMFKRLGGGGNTELVGSSVGAGLSSVTVSSDCRRKSEREVHRPVLYDPSANSSGQKKGLKAGGTKKKLVINDEPLSEGNVGCVSKQRAPALKSPRKKSTSLSPLPAKGRKKGGLSTGEGGKRKKNTTTSQQGNKNLPSTVRDENVAPGGSKTPAGSVIMMGEQQIQEVVEHKLRQLLNEIHPNGVQEKHINDNQMKPITTKENDARMVDIREAKKDRESGTYGEHDKAEQPVLLTLTDAQLSHLQEHLQQQHRGSRSAEDHHHHRDSRHGNHHHHHGHHRSSGRHRRSEEHHVVAMTPVATQQVSRHTSHIFSKVSLPCLSLICLSQA